MFVIDNPKQITIFPVYRVINLPRDLLLKFSCDLVGQLPLPRDMPHSPLTGIITLSLITLLLLF